MRRRNSRRIQHCSAPALVEALENRTLLAAVIPAIQIDNQAPVVLPDVNGRELVALADADSTRLFTTDGTQSGTVQFADIPAVLGGDISGHTIVGTNLFFAAAGLLVADVLSDEARKPVGLSLACLGLAALTPMLVETMIDKLNGPGTRRGSQRTLRGIRNSGLPPRDISYVGAELGEELGVG